MLHLGSTPATVKLKGIDGGPHKRRNMWFNSMIREGRLKCHNERNPHPRLPTGQAGDSVETAGASCEEGGDDVKSARPLRPGRHTCYNGGAQRDAAVRAAADPETPSQFGLESATRLHEAGFASNRASAMAR